MSFVDSLAYRVFGEVLHRREDSFASFKTKLRQAHYPVTVSQYIASATMYSLAGAVFAGFLGILLGWMVFSDPDNSLNSFIEVRWPEFIAEHLFLLVVLIGMLLFLAGFFGLFMLAYSLPYFQIDIRKSSIDRSLLPATTYMYALTRGGMPLFAVFRSITRNNLIFGESAMEIRYIVRDMEYLGKDIITALEVAKTRTPSEHFKGFLEGLIFVSGSGNIEEYLNNKTKQYQELAELANKDYLQKLDTLAEIYVTVLVAGPLFLMTTLIVLQFFRSTSTQILYTLIYLIIPLASLLYLVILDTLGELSFNPEKVLIPLSNLDLTEIPEITSEEDEEKLIKKIHYNAKAYRLKKFLFNPLQTLMNQPFYAFLLGIPAGFLYLASVPKSFSAETEFTWNSCISQLAGGNIEFISWADDHMIIFILIVLIPFIIFYELQIRRGKQIDKQMPEFLKTLASMNASGILLSNALKLMADSKLGVLSKELKKVREDLSWGTSASAALLKLESTIKTATASKILHTLVRANESTGDLKSVLFITSEHVKSEEKLKKERSSQMVIYIFTIYISFAVFLFIVYVLSVYFFPESASLKGSSGIANASFDAKKYTMLMYHSSLIQGLCSGLIAGKMGHGSVYLGLKYSASMMTITYIVFNLFM